MAAGMPVRELRVVSEYVPDEKLLRRAWFFRLLIRLRCPAPIYYWFLDRLTDNNGWRPLSMRHPEWFGR